MRSKNCDNCEHYQSEICPIYNTKLPFEKCPNHWTKHRTKHRQTVFDRITESPETLAETLVYCEQPEYQYSCASWRSVVLGSTSYARKSEALAATVAKLRAVE